MTQRTARATRMRRWLFRGMVVTLASAVLQVSAAEVDDLRALLARGDLQQALAGAEQRLAQQPDDPELRFLSGVILARMERADQAIEVFQALTRDYPGLPEPYNNLAVLYAARGDYDKARDQLLVAISTHPSYATAHENLGDIYARMAGEAYDKALRLDAGNTGAKAKLALIDQLFPRGGATVAATAAATPAPSAAPTVAPAPAAAPVAPATPAVPPAPATPGLADRDAAIALVREWAAAWSARDVKRYLAFYATSFRPSSGIGRKAWVRQRRQRLRAPRFIEVKLDNLEVVALDGGVMEARFVQRYRSDSYRDQVRKVLRLMPTDAGWRISAERVVR